MARTFTFGELVEIVAKGTDLEAIQDIGRRYPVLLNKVTKVAALAGNDFAELMGFVPPYITANKVNTLIKKSMTGETDSADEEVEEVEAEEVEAEETEVEEVEEVKPATKAKREPKAKAEPKVKAEPKAKPGTVIESNDVIGGDGLYVGMSAVELFKLAKGRGIKVQPKQPATYYVALLEKDDKKKKPVEPVVETEDDSDDWDI